MSNRLLSRKLQQAIEKKELAKNAAVTKFINENKPTVKDGAIKTITDEMKKLVSHLLKKGVKMSKEMRELFETISGEIKVVPKPVEINVTPKPHSLGEY
jgi:predicted transcriptional regulator